MSKLEAVSITKSFGDNTILQDVSLRLEPREIVCLLGVSGGGKTTLFNVLSGLTLPDRGQVFLDGREITGKAGHISYMLQKDLLMPYRTVLDNIALPLIIKGAPKKEARRKALEHFAEFGLSGTEKQYPAQLSGGMRQRAALLRTYLCSEGGVRVADWYHLDRQRMSPKQTALLRRLAADLRGEDLEVMEQIELSTLFITHDIDEAILLSDRIYLLSGKPGHITAELNLHKESRPRGDFALTSQFLEYKKEILSLLQF